MLDRNQALRQLELACEYLAERGIEPIEWEPAQPTEVAIYFHSLCAIPTWVRGYESDGEFVLELHMGDVLRNRAASDGAGHETLAPALQSLLDQHVLAA